MSTSRKRQSTSKPLPAKQVEPTYFKSLGQPCPLSLPELVAIGRVGKAHGVHGAFQCSLLTDYPERFEDTEQVHMHNGQTPIRTVEVESASLRSGKIVLKLAGVDSIEQVELLKHYLLCAGEDELVQLEDGEYFHFQLEGLRVVDESDAPVGTLKEVLATPAHEIYVVEREGQEEVLVPAVPEYIKAVDLEQGFVRLRLPVEAQEGDFT